MLATAIARATWWLLAVAATSETVSGTGASAASAKGPAVAADGGDNAAAPPSPTGEMRAWWTSMWERSNRHSNETLARPPTALDCLSFFDSQEALLAAVRRPDVCTLVAIGARWDGHFRHWVGRNGAWDELAALTCKDRGGSGSGDAVDVGVFLYSGESEGPRSIPAELGIGPTIGGFRLLKFRRGIILPGSDTGGRLLEGKSLRELSSRSTLHELGVEEWVATMLAGCGEPIEVADYGTRSAAATRTEAEGGEL